MPRDAVHELPVVRGAVDRDTYTEYRQRLLEVPTDDGMNLVVTHKTPAHQDPVGSLLFLHGLGQNRHTWTLSQRSMVNYLVHHGFETFNAELRGHGLSRDHGCGHAADFDTYLRYDVPALIRTARQASRTDSLFLVGHSLGGIIAYCVAADFQDVLSGIITIASPFNMGRGNSTLRWLARLGILVDRLTFFRRYQPTVFHVDTIGYLARWGLFVLDHRWNRIPIHVWYPRSIERDILIERIASGFDQTSFEVFRSTVLWSARGVLVSNDGLTSYGGRIADIRTPILLIAGDRDHTALPASIEQAFRQVGSNDKTFQVFGSEEPGLHWGHCDLICGRNAPKIVWPFVLEWLKERTPRG